ncbi:MAG: VWA domain-containing protein [Gemmatirosa sp.]|nr:VWA domain-containing protein [Gemmatirosa sp.]
MWADAVPGLEAAVLLAVDPRGLGGAVVRGSTRHRADAWLRVFAALLPAGAPVRRVPPAVSEERLLGGLDLAATLATGCPVAERGVLAAAHGGAIVLGVAATRPATWTHVTRALDTGVVALERDGLAGAHDAAFVAIALDDGDADDAPPAPFLDRVAFVVDLAHDDDAALTVDAASMAAARERLPHVHCDVAALEALGRGAQASGIGSVRVLLAALAAARASAALDDRTSVNADDLARAGRLVLAPHATRVPNEETAPPGEPATGSCDAPSPHRSDDVGGDAADEAGVGPLTDLVVQSVRAALPAGLLAAAAAHAARVRTGDRGRAGADRVAGVRGRQVGTRRGLPRGGARLDLLATLRAAAPLQRLRRPDTAPNGAIAVRRDDFRVRRCVVPARTTTIFLVDASGSAALHRLAEAKGAVEAMLAEGYARRELVAVIAFRGTTAELVLAPTHALARARRAVAALPAGGGTPLATALDRAAQVAQTARREGAQVVVVLLTDARANVARDGRGGRARAESDALAAAATLRPLVDGAVLVDTAARPEPLGTALASALGARHVRMPAADARDIASAAEAARHVR